MNIQEALSLDNKAVISLVGGGGKTSLMYSLARELVLSGKRVLTTTTTKIFIPTTEQSPATIISKTPQEIVENATELLNNYSHITAGSEYLQVHGKLNGLQSCVIEDICRANLFDYLIIEADGAARRSLKAFAPHEPVVPPFTDRIVSVVGLDVVNKPLTEEWVFRSEQYSQITGIQINGRVTESSIAKMLLHDMSSIQSTRTERLNVAFLNKADNDRALRSGKCIADFLMNDNSGVFNRVVIGELKTKPVIHQCRLLT